MTLRNWWRELNGKGLRQGVYKYDGPGELKGHRFHLRIDSESKGALLIDASSIIFLNGTALDYVRCVLEDRDEKGVAKYMRRRYKNLDRSKAQEHLGLVRSQLSEFLKGDNEVLGMIGPDKPSIGKDDFPAP
ncbi:MAG: hypothetical protein JET69_05405, partial [Methanomassiliicoccales archaeon]|nr:hypothetical protein [Methanomassiliicoccales archaeon]